MTVYIDKARILYRRMLMSHMLADTLDELHAMAGTIGVERRHFQANASTPHYDICQTKVQLAVRAGAVRVTRQELVDVIRKLRAERLKAADACCPRCGCTINERNGACCCPGG